MLIFFAWIPLLWLEERVSSRKKFFGLTYITMFIWNVATTWWIWNASAPGTVSAFLANSPEAQVVGFIGVGLLAGGKEPLNTNLNLRKIKVP